ncbi:ATP-binding protein [Streptomonospora sp. S1-112]|uniref:ATP-binding protein n=1 Tax=Streptomonospora mangrovi TaxID=2883123 RepID=A0A9X3NNA2_9ACTN|nr:ATP-binding protein [Streptomonospora mangrovi]MDA0565186.1 ATP-binding protein [Streptomonospora mangrovi]
MAGKRAKKSESQSARDWFLGDREPQLLPTPWLSAMRFESFVERLLKAQTFLGMNERHVANIVRWGVSGDTQGGIDLFGHFNDGVPAAWQCKHLKSLSPARVIQAVHELTFEEAKELYLVYSDVAKIGARNEIKKHPSWQLWDRRDLTVMLRELPVQIQREILDEFWGQEVRRLFLESPDDSFVSIETFAGERRSPEDVMNDIAPLVGRTAEMDRMKRALDRTSGDFRQVVVVTGPGGRGKSRLLTESLLELRERQPHLLVICLRSGWVFSEKAMSELWIGASVVVVDDAHVDTDALAPLLRLARSREDIQIVLATRPSALEAVTQQVILAGFRPSEKTNVPVGELTRTQAQRLVKELTDGMGLSFDLRSYLAGQAEHSPHVAVITTNLIRHGELTAALAVDANLRETVLARYRGLREPEVDGFDGRATRKVLATYAALGAVPCEDHELMCQIADFCDLLPLDLMQIITSLTDHGVLIKQGDMLRVVPDIVADSILEDQAACRNFDTGFVAALWEAFGHGQYQHRLMMSLGELDWRLCRRNGPRVMNRIWAMIRHRLQTLSYDDLYDELGHFQQLAATQPRALLDVLEGLRIRLDEEDGCNTPVPQDSGERSWRELSGRPALGRDDVRSKLPSLYASAAVHAPELLETALDALWALHQHTPYPPHSNTENARWAIEQHLGNLIKLPHSSFPERIVARVTEWLTEPGQGENEATPLFALKPLLVKEEVATVQIAPHTISMQGVPIDATAMRAVRDQIRALLLDQALSQNHHRVSQAIALLQHALRQPRGHFGQGADPDIILSWEDDDLATIAVLTEIARRTSIPALRRRVRHILTWPAERAKSSRVMHAALTTLATLDGVGHLEDDLADVLFERWLVSTRVHPGDVPTLEELEASRATENERTAGLTKSEIQAEHAQQLIQKSQGRHELEETIVDDIVRRLLHFGTVIEMLDLLDRTARDVINLHHDRSCNLWSVWRRIAHRAPEILPDIVREIAGREPGPLDRSVWHLIRLMLHFTPDEGVMWLHGAVVNERGSIKTAIAHAFDRNAWDNIDDLHVLWVTGTSDPDPKVADTFLGVGGPYLRAKPLEAVPFMLDKGITDVAATCALEGASGLDGSAYGAGLTKEEAIAVLRLIGRTDYESYEVQQVLVGIASSHPDLVLNHLAEKDAADIALRVDLPGLGAVYDDHPSALVSWLRQNLSLDPAIQDRLGRVVATAINDRLTQAQGTVLAELVAELDADYLLALTEVLRSVDTWPLRHWVLAEKIMKRARITGCHAKVRKNLLGTMHPGHWSDLDGDSPELNDTLDRARQAAIQVQDSDLRSDYERGIELVQGTLDADRRRHQEDIENGWD